MLSIDSVVSANPRFLSTEIDGLIVMMDVKTGQYYNLDLIGSEIWRLLSSPVSVSELCDKLVRRYNAPLDAIQHDVLRLLQSMQEKELVLLGSIEEVS